MDTKTLSYIEPTLEDKKKTVGNINLEETPELSPACVCAICDCMCSCGACIGATELFQIKN